MNSPFATLFLAIQQRLQEQVPEIRWIDQELGQLEIPGDRPPVSFPCLLIDFDQFKFEDAGELIQFADGVVAFRLGFPPFSPTNNVTPIEWREKGLSYYDLEWKVYKALHGWKPEKYGYLSRIDTTTERREDNIRVRILRYSTSFQDLGAQPEYDTGALPEDLEIGELPD